MGKRKNIPTIMILALALMLALVHGDMELTIPSEARTSLAKGGILLTNWDGDLHVPLTRGDEEHLMKSYYGESHGIAIEAHPIPYPYHYSNGPMFLVFRRNNGNELELQFLSTSEDEWHCFNAH